MNDVILSVSHECRYLCLCLSREYEASIPFHFMQLFEQRINIANVY